MKLVDYTREFIQCLNTLGTGAKLDEIKEVDDDIVLVFNNPIIKHCWSEKTLITIKNNKMILVCFGKHTEDVTVYQSKDVNLPLTEVHYSPLDETTPKELAQLVTDALH